MAQVCIFLTLTANCNIANFFFFSVRFDLIFVF